MPLISVEPSSASGVPVEPRAVITSTDSLRKQIMSAVATRLATITTANGYRTNAGTYAYEWRGHDFGTDMLPGLEYRDTGQAQEYGGAEEVVHNLHVEITALAATGATVRDVIADVVECIGTDVNWSGLADTTKLIIAPVETVQLNTGMWGAGIEFDIEYTTGLWNPEG